MVVVRKGKGESFLLLLRTLRRRAVKGRPKSKYATTRSMRATRFLNLSVYQPHQRSKQHVHITIRSVQQTLIDGEMGVQWVGDALRLVISMTLRSKVQGVIVVGCDV